MKKKAKTGKTGRTHTWRGATLVQFPKTIEHSPTFLPNEKAPFSGLARENQGSVFGENKEQASAGGKKKGGAVCMAFLRRMGRGTKDVAGGERETSRDFAESFSDFC